MWGQSAESLQMTDGGQSDGCRFRIHPAGSLENKNKKRFEKDQAKTTRKKKKGKKKRRKGIVNYFLHAASFLSSYFSMEQRNLESFCRQREKVYLKTEVLKQGPVGMWAPFPPQ